MRLNISGRTLAVMAALVLVLGSTGCSAASNESKGGGEEPIRIGAVLSLTGTYAALGEAEQNALKLEEKRINDAGGIDGRQVEIVIEDDATDEAQAVAKTSKLIGQDKVVAILGASGTGQTMAMRTEIQRAGVPQISMAGGSAVTAKFDPLVFQTPWANKIVVPFVLAAMKADGHTRIGLISDSGGYGKDGREIVLTEAKKAGIEVVTDETYNAGDADMTAQLTKVRSSGADALLLWCAGKEAVTIAKNARALGLQAPIYGGSGQARVEFVSGGGEAVEGVVFGTGKSLIAENWGSDSEQYKAVSDFAKRYEAAYGEKPDIFAGHAYDAFGLIVDAIVRAGSTEPKALRDALEGTESFKGFGGDFAFSPTDHNGLTTEDLALYRVEGGKWVSAQ